LGINGQSSLPRSEKMKTKQLKVNQHWLHCRTNPKTGYYPFMFMGGVNAWHAII